MNKVNPPMRNFARRLMDFEAGETKASGMQIPAAFRSCEKLRLHLATFMGNTGFHTLLTRAFALAAVEVPWLRTVRVKAGEPLEGLEDLQAQLAPGEFIEGEVVLLAQLLGLLVAFIGENLTWRMVREVWPKIPLHALDFGNPGKNGDGGQSEYSRGKNEYRSKNEKIT